MWPRRRCLQRAVRAAGASNDKRGRLCVFLKIIRERTRHHNSGTRPQWNPPLAPFLCSLAARVRELAQGRSRFFKICSATTANGGCGNFLRQTYRLVLAPSRILHGSQKHHNQHPRANPRILTVLESLTAPAWPPANNSNSHVHTPNSAIPRLPDNLLYNVRKNDKLK